MIVGSFRDYLFFFYLVGVSMFVFVLFSIIRLVLRGYMFIFELFIVVIELVCVVGFSFYYGFYFWSWE